MSRDRFYYQIHLPTIVLIIQHLYRQQFFHISVNYSTVSIPIRVHQRFYQTFSTKKYKFRVGDIFCISCIKMVANVFNLILSKCLRLQKYHLPCQNGKYLQLSSCCGALVMRNYKRDAATACNPHNSSGSV